jgi:predicted DNA-binding transcriptional regulator AlpA
MQSKNHVLRTPQAAEYVGLSPSTLEKFRLTGNGPPYQKAGPKIVVYRPEDLDAWLSANRRRSTSDTGSTTATGRNEP